MRDMMSALRRIEALTGTGDYTPEGAYEVGLGGWIEEGEPLVWFGKMKPLYSTMYYQVYHRTEGLVWVPTNSVIELKE
jgi:hypothetical protein